MAEVRPFMGNLWYQDVGGIVTIGISEEGLEDFSEITSVELGTEGEAVEAEAVVGTIETDDGPLDIYTPVKGTILEVNNQAVEDPQIIMEDPTEEGWLVRIEAADSIDDEDEDEDDDKDKEEDEEDSDED